MAKKRNRNTKLVEAKLEPRFPKTEAYQYNSASIRVRIVDNEFRGKNMVEREQIVLPLIRELPRNVQDDITILLLLAPDETKSSMMNLEFEQPTPSQL
jgi:stress-induced morphogen